MLMDHITATLLHIAPHPACENYLRMPGRIAIPLFAFLIAYAYEKFSSNRVHYALRLWLFAVISEPAYIILFGKSGNAMFPLALGVTSLLLLDGLKDGWKHFAPLISIGIVVAFTLLLNDVSVASICVLVVLFRSAIKQEKWLLWSLPIASTIALCNRWEWQFLIMVPISILFVVAAFYVPCRAPILRVNKWIWYAFYPAHLLILVGISYLL